MIQLTAEQPAADAWFAARGWSPFPFQRQVWQAHLDGRSGLLHPATGAGQTQAAGRGPQLEWRGAVSYTHLTKATNDPAKTSGGGGC